MNIDGQALKFRKGLLEICDLVQRLAQYPDDFHLLFRFVTLPQVITRQDDVTQTASSTPAAATLARKSSLGSLSQQQCALFQQQEEAILRNGCSNLLILAQRLRIASVEQLRGAMALGSRTELTRSDLNSAESLFAGVEWDVTKAVVQIYLLRDLIFWYSSIETLFRIVPDNSNVLAAGTFSLVSPEQHQASLEVLSAFLKEHCNVDWENLRKNVWEQGGSTSGSRMEYLVRVLALPQSQIQVYGPLLSFLSLSPKEMANVRDSLVMLCSVQMFQVSRLRTLSEIEIYELKSLLGIDLFNQQQQQQQQQQIPPLKQAKMVINNASTNDISAGSSTFLPFNDTQQQQIPQSLQSQQQQSQQIPASLQSQQQPQQQQQFVMEPLQRNMIPQTLPQGIQQTEPEINTILPPPQLPTQTLQPQQSTTPPPPPPATTTAQTSQSMIDIIQQQQQQQQPQQQSQLQLTIIEQPPERCVYKRNIKPGPTVVVSGGTTNDLTSLAVAILLYRCDTNTNESRNLSGHTPIDVTPSRVVVFRRLKILSTSHQLSETLFVLRFELRRYHNGPIGVGDYEVLNVATSTPINVVSHSTQLRTLSATSVPSPMSSSGSSNSATNQQSNGDQQDSTQGIGAGKRPHEAVGAVTVSEIIPASGACRGGTRVAILGSNFSNSPGMRVLFGNVEVVPTFYAQGTITCVTPEHSPGVVPVRVCNIPKCWSDSSVSFTYEDTPRTLRGVVQQSSQFAGPSTTTTTAATKAQGVEQQQQQHTTGTNPSNNTNDGSNDVIIDNASNSANNLSTSMEVEKTNPLSPTVTMQVQSQQEMISSPQRGGVVNNVQSTNLSKDLLLPSPKTFTDSNMTISNVSTPSSTMLPTSNAISTSSPQSLSSPAITTTAIGTIHPSQQQPSPSSMLPMQLISPHTITPPNNVNSNVCTCGCNCKNTSNTSNTLSQNNNINVNNNNNNNNNNFNINNNNNVNINNNNTNVNINVNNNNLNVNINNNRVINEETEAMIKRISSGDFDGLCQMRLSRTGVNSLDSRGFAPLHYIATAPSVPRNAIDTLIQAGGDINIRDEYANTPIHWAAMAGNPACISNLLALGADPSAQNYDGETPLHVAASIHLQTSVQCCRALIAAGASPNVTENSRCETPLHRAAAENNADIITVLIEAGALVGARDEDSYTPLHVAVMAAAGAAVKVLLEKGKADPNAVSGDGETPLQLAEAAGNQEIRALLLAAGARVAETVVTTAPARPRTRSNPVEMKRPFCVDRQVPSYLSPVKNCNDVNMTSSTITTSSTST